MLSNLNKNNPEKKTSAQPPSPVVVRPEKVVVVIQDRSGSMCDFMSCLDAQLMKRQMGNQYIYFASRVERRDDVECVYVGSGTDIFPAFEEMFAYLRATLPKKVDIVFISDGEDNSGLACRANFATHIGKFEDEVPGIEEHRLFTIGVGPNFPSDLVSPLEI